MTVQKNICEAIRNFNPFASVSAGDPREFRFPDVPDVDRNVFESLLGIISQKINNPATTCSVAVVGEAGSGKTQLIGRLASAGAKGKTPFTFAYIHPFVDPYQGYRYLLKEVFINLKSKPMDGLDYTQLDLICSGIFAKVFTLVAEDKGTKTMLKEADIMKKEPFLGWRKVTEKPDNVKRTWFKLSRNTLMERHPCLEPLFLKVMLQYLFYPEKRLAAEQWLKGYTIDSDMVSELGVQDRSSLEPEALEEEARKIILSLDEFLLHYGDRPIVVFFDQLEGLHGDKVLEKFQDMLQMLTDVTRSMMPMAFFRGTDWEEKFESKINNFIYNRLRGSEFQLQGCTSSQALELIRLRLNMVLGDMKRPDPLYPFVPDYKIALDQLFRAKYILPRQVVVRANKLLGEICKVEPPIPDDNRIIRDALKSQYEEILANIEKYEPDEGRLTLALELYLKNRPAGGPYTTPVLEPTPEKVRYLDLEGDIAPRGRATVRTAFLIDVERHHASVRASLTRGVNFLAQPGERRALFIRDVRAPFPEPPRWPGTNEKLTEFKNTGGAALMLEDENAAHWYALALLSFAVDAGDITRPDGVPLERKHLDAFVAKHMSGKTYPAFQGVDEYLGNVAPPEPPAVNGELVELSTQILRKTPAKLMKAELLMAKLQKKVKVECTLAILLPELKEHDERFSIIPAKDGVIVKLKLDWVQANA